MRAIQYSQVAELPQLVELPEPECPVDGAVLAVRATGVCRSDWHAWRGHDPVPLPMVPGHEFAGEIVRVGPLVREFRVGERVTAPFVNGCGACEECRAGNAQVCPNQTQPGFTHHGSFAEQVVVRQADFNLVRLPDQVAYVTAAALGCRFATSFHAVTRQAGLQTGEWLLVLGCGGVGLSAVMIAKALGAQVIAVDPSPSARQRAAELGAEHVLAAADPDAIIELSGGGVQVSLDALGSAATAAAGVRSLRRRGRHVQVGLMLDTNAEAGLPWGPVVARELQVMGSHGMAAKDYPELLALIADGRLDPSVLVGKVVDLEQAGLELAAMDAPAQTAGLVVARLS